jgi:hypothetical protein
MLYHEKYMRGEFEDKGDAAAIAATEHNEFEVSSSNQCRIDSQVF